MKKYLLFIPLLAIYLTSCTFEGSQVAARYITIEPHHWVGNAVYSRTEGYSSATFGMPQITSHVIEKGAVMCYLVGNEYDSVLPLTMTSVDGAYRYTTNVLSFDIAKGEIRFISENSDLDIAFPTVPIQIKIVIID